MPKRITLTERAHWSRVQAQVIGRFNFWGKPKQSPEVVAKLAGEVADAAVNEFRKRTHR